MLSWRQEVVTIATRQKAGWTQIPPFMVPDELVKAIEDIQFEHRFPNRSEALRKIIEEGVAVMKDKGRAPQS